MSDHLQVVEMPNRQKAACLDDARALVERVESGNVVGFTMILEHPDGTYTVGGPATLSRLQSAGALLDAAIGRLKS